MDQRVNNALTDLVQIALESNPLALISLRLQLVAEDEGRTYQVLVRLGAGRIEVYSEDPVSLQWDAGIAVDNQDGTLRARIWDSAHMRSAEGVPNQVFRLSAVPTSDQLQRNLSVSEPSIAVDPTTHPTDRWMHISVAYRNALLELIGQSEVSQTLAEIRNDLRTQFTRDAEELWYLEAVKDQTNEELEVDAAAVVSMGDEEGAFVQGWIFVPSPQACSEEGCEARGDAEGFESTSCGSFCDEHLRQHVKDCDICAADFPELVEDDEDDEDDNTEEKL